MKPARVVSLVLVGVMGCNSVPPKHPASQRGVIRYLLPLRNNKVSSSDAAHCYVACQSASTPNAYVDCLSACPGFETTPGEACESTDVPPESVCLTVHKIPAKNEPPPGMVVLAIVGEIALVVGAASLCSISSTQCGWQMPPPH